MSPEIYKIIHLAGLMALFLAFGGVLALQGAGNKSSRRLVAIAHGAGLLLLLLGGFGMIARLNYGFPGWVIAKFVIWLILGAALILGKRRFFSPAVLWGIVVALGILAAYLGIKKPF